MTEKKGTSKKKATQSPSDFKRMIQARAEGRLRQNIIEKAYKPTLRTEVKLTKGQKEKKQE